jgi:hypothetical protein
MNFVKEIELLAQAVKTKSETAVQRELIDPIEMYQKHY